MGVEQYKRTAASMALRRALTLLCVWAVTLPAAQLVPAANPTANPVRQTRQTGPPLLTYEELVRLYEEDSPSAELQSKLSSLLTTPFVSNAAAARHTRPLKPSSPRLGKSVRVAAWNIERGLEFEAMRAAFVADDKFFRRRSRQDARRLAPALEQAEMLRLAGIVVLNEVDWGLKRTGYRHVARELADATGMNYAYGVEFVEVDPLTLGTETFDGEVAEDRAELVGNLAADRQRTHGLHGTAILSRYPLKNVRLVRFRHQGHDWYADEKKKVSKLEAGKRAAAGAVFREKVLREVRRGGRMMLLADIEDEEIPGGALTVVATHLEAKTKPASRVKQLEEVLTLVKGINHPVIVAGDMNTTGADSTPTSFEREVRKRAGSTKFWATRGIKYATGVGLLYDVTLGTVKSRRTKNDPTVKSIRFVSENPEEKFFTTLEEFRFGDGGAFDFRGTPEFSVGGSREKLANSNERASKGFVSTFELQGKVDIRLKLDWVFVKPTRLTDPENRGQSYAFAPRFGRTLKALNYSLGDRISDHNPLIVDLPLEERNAARP
jgi:endonuclease/exonuclease/phosphatase family metal-dependent hydrolase